ncbi:nitrous oxide reductase accessory protein NosL [Shinella sp. S4-D37]|uniref:nitrous oxide reductase accessory protein NosL n=1 Tax=Shinella sp. S4-D37 TaxID=3161999 RepID=UPI00346785E4
MNLLEHPGPRRRSFWRATPRLCSSASVRDAIAYMRGPEQVAPILAVYVTDMGRAGATWDRPGDGNWVVADEAFYVLGSARAGGMGAPEAVPFSSRERGRGFRPRRGRPRADARRYHR